MTNCHSKNHGPPSGAGAGQNATAFIYKRTLRLYNIFLHTIFLADLDSFPIYKAKIFFGGTAVWPSCLGNGFLDEREFWLALKFCRWRISGW